MDVVLILLEQWLLLLAAGVGAALAALWSYRRQSGSKEGLMRLPPGPPGWPVIGNLGIFVTNSHPHQELHRLATEYGGVMSVRLGAKTNIIVSSPKMAEEVLKTMDKEFASRPQLRVTQAMLYGEDCFVFLPNNNHWKFMRRVAVTELLTPKRVEQFGTVRQEEVSRLVRWLEAASRQSTAGSGVDVSLGVRTTVTNSMTRILMGKRFLSYPGAGVDDTEESSELKEMIRQAFFLAGVSFIGDAIPALGFLDRIMDYEGAMRRLHKQYDAFLGGVLEEHRRRNGSGNDFMDILLSLPGEDGAPRLRDSTIKGLIMDLLNGGSDSSGITIEWGLSELLAHPAALRRVQAELDAAVGRERAVEEADLPRLPFFQAVVKEVFRLHPAGAFLAHHNPQRCRLAGYDIPAGTTVLVNCWAVARSAQAWERPLEFLPERFLPGGSAEHRDVLGKHFELVPFGSGRRSCPGINLAGAVVQYSLARLVHAFDWGLPQGAAGAGAGGLDMSEKFGLSIPKATPLVALPKPRLPHHLYS